MFSSKILILHRFIRMAYTSTCFLAYTLFLTGFLLVTASAISTGGDYGSKNIPKKPNLEKEKLLSTKIGIQGLVYCKSASKLIPLQGGVTRITCEAADEYGYETAPFNFLSDATDAKGYFLATLCPWEVADKRELKECRAFLDLSPLDNCTVPTDINKGLSGALLHSHRFLPHNNMKLYTAGPFFFISESKPISNKY